MTAQVWVAITQAIGWFSSLILLLTLSNQVYRQWQEGSSKGVSKWLFIGQMAASTGFTIYSWLVKDWIFVITNSLMMLNGLAGLVIVQVHKRRERRGARPRGAGCSSP